MSLHDEMTPQQRAGMAAYKKDSINPVKGILLAAAVSVAALFLQNKLGISDHGENPNNDVENTQQATVQNNTAATGSTHHYKR